MGLNDIRLTASALVELYGHSLVDTGDVPAVDRRTSPSAGPGPAAEHGLPAQSPDSKVNATGERKAPATIPVSQAPAAFDQPAAPAAKEKKQPVREAAPQSPWRSLGNNRRHILVVVDYEGTAYLPDDELTFLTKMLDACKLSLDDVAIVNRAHYRTATSAEYLKHFASNIVFLFGPEPAAFGLPISFPPFQVQAFAGTTFLHTPPLEERMRDDLYKSKLWVSLKRIFNL